MRELNWTDYRKAHIALRFVLQGLRDHLPVSDAINLGNQLPALIRGFYFEDGPTASGPGQFTQLGEPRNFGATVSYAFGSVR